MTSTDLKAVEARIWTEQEKADYSASIRDAWCPRTRVSTARATANDRLAMFFIQCKSWSCDACGPRKKRELVAKILRGKPQRFLTLTVRAPTAENGLTWTPREAFDCTRRACSRLFQKMARETGRKTEYVRVLEQTKRGYPHYHYLTKGPYWSKASISGHWQQLTGSYILDIQKPKRAEQTIAYVAKYVSKSTSVDFTERRVSASRNFFQRCGECGKSTCICRSDDWYDFEQCKGHFQEVVERYATRQQLVPGPTPTIWWIEKRQPGCDIPEALSRHFLCNQDPQPDCPTDFELASQT